MSSLTSPRIDSPYAKVNTAGQVTCILCNCPVKSAKVWIAHANGRQHRQNLASRDKKQDQKPPTPSTAQSATQKRPIDSVTKNGQNAGGMKKPRSESAQTPITSSTKPAPEKVLSTSARDESGSDVGSEEPVTTATTSSSDLPPDFFDVPMSSTNDGENENKADSTAERTVKGKGEDLPEGFFDDKKKDAKARGVELKDPLDEEWGKFQKELQKAEVVSEQIVEEDEGQMTIERELDEAEEQMREWSRINELEKRKDTVSIHVTTATQRGSEGGTGNEEESDDNLEDVDLENVLDWRSKDVWK